MLYSRTITEINYRLDSYLIDDPYDDYDHEDDSHNNKEDDEKKHCDTNYVLTERVGVLDILSR
ncbi:hypothetical protein ACPUYX_17840 [Desulfosporosinus sp. SYSU MS00001]|uniref:hypothetical protein n=1 Tax=Desulfosporosinus sp. SYSU MS00001 TaxID=3416284 RepID=UPI003CF3F86E